MKLYKTDYVRPLVNYIIDHLKNESLILHCLLRYKSRVERFKTIQDLDLTESIIQKDLALCLAKKMTLATEGWILEFLMLQNITEQS